MSFQRQQLADLEARVAKLEAALAQPLPPPPALTTPMKILRIVDMTAAEAGLQREDLLGKCRRLDIVAARHTAMYLAYETTPASTVTIAEVFDCDHTGVSYGVRRIRQMAATNPVLAAELARTTALLSQLK